MINILVPTDFSDNSKAGLRFAIRWSLCQPVHLIFIHIFNAKLTPLSTDEEDIEYIGIESRRFKDKLHLHINSVYKSLGMKPGEYSSVVREGISADLSIMDYCRENDHINYICISTRGAGNMDKIFGTNTGNLITKSVIPVLAIPKKYRYRELKSLLYTSDLLNSDAEIKEVLNFARPLKINIKILHLLLPDEASPDKKTLDIILRKKFSYDMEVVIVKVNTKKSIRENLEEQIKLYKPSLIAMFTDQNRSIFQKLFYPSKAEQISFTTSVPLLTFRKSKS